MSGGVQGFRPGDAVFGDMSGCGWGGLSEYVRAPARVRAVRDRRVPRQVVIAHGVGDDVA